MMQARTVSVTVSALLQRMMRFAKTGWGGLLFALAAVLAAVGFRAAFMGLAHFYYLPMMAAVMASALLAHRHATLAAIGFSVAANLVLVARPTVLDAAINAALFVVVAWVMAEICHRLIAALVHARALSRDLTNHSALLDTILASIPVVTLDGEGRILRVTPASADLLGVSSSQALGRAFGDFAVGFDAAALAAFKEGGAFVPPSVGHWTAQRPDGEEIPLTIHAKLLSEDAGPERIVLSLGDQRQAQAARERATDFNTQLHRVWRLNSMGELAATLAHELNQPLAAATAYLHAGQTDIARVGLIGESAARALDLAKTQILRAGDIIRRMRDLISTGAHSFSDERVSLMIRDLTPVFTLTGRDTGVTVRIDVNEADDRVRVDRIQIQQAVANLVRNAVDAVSGRDDGLIRVTGRAVGNQGYEIVVEDNGPGIPEDQMDRIFQPMITTKAGGMGLGLSVTRSIIESHDASLTVRPSPLGGAAFSFRLSRVSELEAA